MVSKVERQEQASEKKEGKVARLIIRSTTLDDISSGMKFCHRSPSMAEELRGKASKAMTYTTAALLVILLSS
jgi:hypothetical protein